MSDKGFSTFATTMDKTNHILKLIEQAYGWPHDLRRQSYAALRAVLHALRDRLTVEEAAQLSAQLPILVRGIYFDGWVPSRVPMKMHREEILQRVAENFPYEVEGGVERLIPTVLEALRVNITEGEWEDVKSSMPKELATILP
jgi:uncharacterized protein (DUF2267 family)